MQRFCPVFGNRSGPAAHRLTADLHPPSHLTLVVSLFQELQGRKASLLQSSEIPFHAARITHTALTISAAGWLRYIMRKSVIATANAFYRAVQRENGGTDRR